MKQINIKTHIKQLDGVRFLAVSLVLADHWSGETLGFNAGYLGVCMFFVLSGFLITRILLHSKVKDSLLNRSHKASIKQFYIRRTIRIFPIYYLTIFVLFLVGVPSVRATLLWCLTYTTNIYIATHARWLGTIDHLWSLAVEEQFYVFFPFVIFFIPNRYLNKMLFGFIFLSVSLRLFFFLNGTIWMAPYVLMPTCLDAFGMGGLLAYAYFTDNQAIKRFITNKIWLFVSLFLYILIVIWSQSFAENQNIVVVVFLRFFEALLSVFIIGNAAYGFNFKPSRFGNIMTKFLENPIVLYIGKISYGIYIYHNFIYNYYHTPPNHPTIRLLNHLPFVRDSLPIKIVFLYVITICVATISWHFIEKPINKLKDRYNY